MCFTSAAATLCACSVLSLGTRPRTLSPAPAPPKRAQTPAFSALATARLASPSATRRVRSANFSVRDCRHRLHFVLQGPSLAPSGASPALQVPRSFRAYAFPPFSASSRARASFERSFSAVSRSVSRASIFAASPRPGSVRLDGAPAGATRASAGALGRRASAWVGAVGLRRVRPQPTLPGRRAAGRAAACPGGPEAPDAVLSAVGGC